ncbi:MAG: energy transducer TonB [Desulfobacterales bacterium]|nr:energy transducer TonB [Desulfobacterales bacterium]
MRTGENRGLSGAGKPGVMAGRKFMTGLLALSLGVHFLVLMQVPKMLGSRLLPVIEFSVEDDSGPAPRSIPRPRMRSGAVYQAKGIQKAETAAKVSVPDDLQDARIPDPAVPVASALPSVQGIVPGALVRPVLSGFSPGVGGGETVTGGRFLSKKDYFEMLRLRIETHKTYPSRARSKYIEGRVGLYFKVRPDGSVSDLKITRPARHNSLNRAALKAVTDSAPFSMLPLALFQGAVEIEITLLFELA